MTSIQLLNLQICHFEKLEEEFICFLHQITRDRRHKVVPEIKWGKGVAAEKSYTETLLIVIVIVVSLCHLAHCCTIFVGHLGIEI